MGALLDDASAVEDDEAVHAGDGAQAVGDHEGRTSVHQPPQGVLDQEFALRVQRAGRLVEQQDRGVAQDGPGEGDALALTAGQLHPALPTSVPKPSGSWSANSVTCAAAAAAWISSSVAPGRAKAMLSRRLRWSMAGSCGT